MPTINAMKTIQKQFSMNRAAAKSKSLSVMLDSQFAGHDGRVSRAMNRVVIAAIAGVLSCLLTGCSNLTTVQLGAFREASCPVDNKAVLRLINFPNLVAEVRIDDEVVGAYTFVEMLPGRHQIDIEWFSKITVYGNEMPDHSNKMPDLSHKGEFVAENGKEYYLFIDMDESHEHEYTVRGVSILEFPADFHPSQWKQTSTFTKYKDGEYVPNYEFLRQFKRVAILRRSESGSGATAYAVQLALLRQKAERGNALAQSFMGLRYEAGIGVPQDYKEAVRWYRLAAEQENAGLQPPLARCYYEGIGVPQDYKEAVKWYRIGAEKGVAEAQYKLGECYRLGRGVPQDDKEAAKWYLKAAEQGYEGSKEALRTLGAYTLAAASAVKDRVVSADQVKEFRNAAEQGDAMAQLNLGLCYYDGTGLHKDKTEAAKWFRKAAEQGNAMAQFYLGGCYVTGGGVPKDGTEAAKWWRKAADQGLADAQYTLGLCYYNGDSVPKDETEAVRWFRKAAEQGNALAQYNFGVCYYNGDGLPKDETEAVRWFRKAADQGYEEAKAILSKLGK